MTTSTYIQALQSCTQRQREVYEYIRKMIDLRGYGPTMREVGEQFDIGSPNGVAGHFQALERKGLITRGDGARAIQLVHQSTGLSVIGGLNERGFTEIEDVSVPEFKGKVVLVMQDMDGLRKGDQLLVNTNNLAGDIVLRLVDGRLRIAEHPGKHDGGILGTVEWIRRRP